MARSRQMAEYGARKRAAMDDALWQADQEAFAQVLVPRAGQAYQDGVAPLSAQGAALATGIFEAWSQRLGRTPDPAGRARLLESLEVMNDKRVNRFWELVGIVGGRPQPAAAGAPLYESMQWLCEALRAAG